MSATGVLILKGNRTYAPPPSHHHKANRQYYKCIPRIGANNGANSGDANNGAILVPFVKGVGFNKVQENLYILYDIADAIDGATGLGILREVIGPVSSFDAFQKYELMSRGLYNSLSAHNKYINARLSDINYDDMAHFRAKYGAHDAPILNPSASLTLLRYETPRVITIDPKGALDLDDAISIIDHGPTIEVSVYISLVAGWLDYLDDWHNICNPSVFRASTIYLSGGDTRPIFPVALSHGKMSLLADGNMRPVLTTHFTFDKTTKGLVNYWIGAENIIVHHNYIYDSDTLEADATYRELMAFTYGAGACTVSGGDSHTLVEHWMLQTGLLCGKELHRRKLPAIYRECIDVGVINGTNLALAWKSYKSQYVFSDGDNIEHVGLNGTNYVHITSPIRRWVDIWNQSLLLNGCANEVANGFILQKGVLMINEQVRQIRKLARVCGLLYDVMRGHCDCVGYPYCDDGGIWRIYLPKYGVWCRAHTPLTVGGSGSINCRLVYFECEHNIKKKVRVMVVL